MTTPHRLTPSRTDDLTRTRALWALVAQGADTGSASLDPAYRRFTAVLDAFDTSAEALEHWALIDDSRETDLFASERLDRALAEAAAEVDRWKDARRLAISFPGLDYPSQLSEIADAPPILFIEGDADVLARPAIAVVGTRKASDEGKRRAARAAAAFSAAGFVVTSGLAKGIDTAVHEQVLAVGGITVAVMGTPIDRRYPAENSELASRIVQSGGALVTEFLPGTATQPWHFLRRNRTMSGLVNATVVIEAGETSGARSQALAALEHGRPVFLPSSLVESHEWARRLVEIGRDGLRAVMVDSPDDVIASLRGGDGHPVSSPAF